MINSVVPPDEDGPAAFASYSDPEVMRYLGKLPHRDLAESVAQLDRKGRVYREGTGVQWSVVRREDGCWLGACGHWRLMREHLRSEVGYDLTRDAWGAGVMTEAMGAALAYGFTVLRLHSTEAQIDPENERSRRLLLRLGFREDGRLRENFRDPEGRFTDTAVFTLLAREFQALPRPEHPW